MTIMRLRRAVLPFALLILVAGLSSIVQPRLAGASPFSGQAIVNAALPETGFHYCFFGGTAAGASVGSTDKYSDGSYSNCNQIGAVGFDCTGLTLYAVAQASGGSVVLSHDGDQAANAIRSGGQVISNASDLQPGDLVYFDDNASHGLGYIDHVGIETSSGVLSAVSEKWGIRTQSIAWYAAGGLHFVGGVRLWTGGGGSSPVGIVGASTSPGALNEDYSFQLQAQGGSAPYKWSVASGNLPSGLSLTTGGNLQGVPNVPGSSTFSVRATDINGASAEASETLTVQPNGNQYVYYVGSDHAIHLFLWNGTSWDKQFLGGDVAAGTSPTAFTRTDGNQYVYYVGPDHAIHLLLWNGTSWGSQFLGGSVAAGTSPTAFTSSNGYQYVYYVGVDHTVNLLLWNGTSWGIQHLGGSVEASSSPNAFSNGIGRQFVYYVGTDHAVHLLLWNGTSWGNQTLGGSVALRSSPSAFTRPDGNQYVYYVGADHTMNLLLWNGSSWGIQRLGGAVAANASPEAFTNASGQQYVYCGAPGKVIHLWFWSGTSWQLQSLGGQIDPAGRPSGFVNAGGLQYIYVVGVDRSINLLQWNGASWSTQRLGGRAAVGGGPAVF